MDYVLIVHGRLAIVVEAGGSGRSHCTARGRAEQLLMRIGGGGRSGRLVVAAARRIPVVVGAGIQVGAVTLRIHGGQGIVVRHHVIVGTTAPEQLSPQR